MRITTILLSSILCMSVLSCSSSPESTNTEAKEPNTKNASIQNVSNEDTPDKKIVGSWKLDLSAVEGGSTVKSIQKYAADKTFLFILESSVEGVKGSTQTGTWRVEDKKIILSPIDESGRTETDAGHYDIIQIGENSMTLKNGKDLLVLIKVV
ncbi:hypothetical protein [Hymenobacter sp. PAMC 26628]|uniref:hypothetical protein n=1 Tax=Hymenobacter sp. PAMC 26628 TaxID=1484118 RepID=UPI00138F736F|nr:hypothetical protein [Hymenobacter sp. PAMC 26628]